MSGEARAARGICGARSAKEIDVLTLFPEVVDVLNSYGVIGRAIEKEIFSLNSINIRDFSKEKHRKVPRLVCFDAQAALKKTVHPPRGLGNCRVERLGGRDGHQPPTFHQEGGGQLHSLQDGDADVDLARDFDAAGGHLAVPHDGVQIPQGQQRSGDLKDKNLQNTGIYCIILQ